MNSSNNAISMQPAKKSGSRNPAGTHPTSHHQQRATLQNGKATPTSNRLNGWCEPSCCWRPGTSTAIICTSLMTTMHHSCTERQGSRETMSRNLLSMRLLISTRHWATSVFRGSSMSRMMQRWCMSSLTNQRQTSVFWWRGAPAAATGTRHWKFQQATSMSIFQKACHRKPEPYLRLKSRQAQGCCMSKSETRRPISSGLASTEAEYFCLSICHGRNNSLRFAYACG
jgi:hypothetical protein